MSLVDPVSDALINIKNHEMASKRTVFLKPASKLLGEILRVMQKTTYLGTYEYVDDGKSGIYKIDLTGKINECKAIKPRYPVKKNEFEKFEKRFLPAHDVGLLIVTTSKGVMTHKEAKQQGLGGRLLAYVF